MPWVLIYLVNILSFFKTIKAPVSGADLAVVVTTYNRPEALAWTLASLSQQSVMPRQILVADDGSGDETKQMVLCWARYFRERHAHTVVEHVWQDDLGFRAGAARNLAVAHATKNMNPEVLIFIDGDCIASPSFVRNHLGLLTEGVMVAGGRGLLSPNYTRGLEQAALNAEPQDIVSGLSVFASPFRLWLSNNCDRYLSMQHWMSSAFLKLRDSRPRDDKLVRTCNLSVRYADFLRVGGFNEDFIGWGLEDTELAVRLIADGVRVRSGRFATNVFHMWHAERSRADLDENARRLAISRQLTSSSNLRA